MRGSAALFTACIRAPSEDTVDDIDDLIDNLGRTFRDGHGEQVEPDAVSFLYESVNLVLHWL